MGKLNNPPQTMYGKRLRHKWYCKRVDHKNKPNHATRSLLLLCVTRGFKTFPRRNTICRCEHEDISGNALESKLLRKIIAKPFDSNYQKLGTLYRTKCGRGPGTEIPEVCNFLFPLHCHRRQPRLPACLQLHPPPPPPRAPSMYALSK